MDTQPVPRAAARATSNPRVGTILADYRLEKQLGRGGMGVVYLAQHRRLKRMAAVKILSPELADDDGFRRRFIKESELAASLDHPNIIPIFDAGEDKGLLYIAMRFVKSTDLRELLDAEGPIDIGRALAIVGQVASALDAAHAEGLVHRDVKPANILVATGAGTEKADHIYLSDFGLSKHSSSRSGLTKTGFFVGTLDYAAPEQIEGRPVDGRTDLYALGCVLFECLAGRPPFVRDDERGMMWAHLSEPPPSLASLRPELPPTIDSVISRALAKGKEDRYTDCADLVAAARSALVGGPAESPVREGMGGRGETVAAPPPAPVGRVRAESVTEPEPEPEPEPEAPVAPAEPQPTKPRGPRRKRRVAAVTGLQAQAPSRPAGIEEKEEVSPAPPSPPPRVAAPPPSPSATRRRRLRVLMVVAAGLMLGGAIAAVVLVLPDRGTEQAAQVEEAPPPGAPSDPGETAPATPASVGAPTKLRAVNATASEVKLIWQRPAGGAKVAHFRVFRDGDPVGKRLETRSFVDDDVEPGALHRYRVVAFGVDGSRASSKALAVEIPTPPPQAPSQPSQAPAQAPSQGSSEPPPRPKCDVVLDEGVCKA